MARFHVTLKRVIDNSYDIEIGHNLFQTLINDLGNGMIEGVDKYAIISDSTVEKLYGIMLLEEMKSKGFNVNLFSFDAGEKNKNRETKSLIEDLMLEKAYGRDSCIIALGGGAVTDMSGFIAGTFGRGIPFINYATTLLAAADASVGGKSAVNTPVATNLIGVFNQPVKVYIDIDTWKTLPAREIRSGLAETIKHACLADKKFFEFLEENISKVITEDGQIVLDMTVCEHIAYKNCKTKYNVVKIDEKETNLRQVLNLGHTIGRAVETISNYELLHGEALAIGIAAQAMMGRKLGFLTEDEMNRVINLIKKVGLMVEIPKDITTHTLVNKLYTDKKVRKNQIRFVFQDGIGKVKQFEEGDYSIPLTEEFIFKTINEVRINQV